MHFIEALSDLLKLYIDKFNTKKRHGYLPAVEQNVIQIIKDVTECAENKDIDINKERGKWFQYVKMVENWRDKVKVALYSQNTTKMAEIQRLMKLEGIEQKEAAQWIAEREQQCTLKNKSLTKLDEMRREDNVLITSIYNNVHRCVKTAEDSHKAWIKFIEQRSTLSSSTA